MPGAASDSNGRDIGGQAPRDAVAIGSRYDAAVSRDTAGTLDSAPARDASRRNVVSRDTAPAQTPDRPGEARTTDPQRRASPEATDPEESLAVASVYYVGEQAVKGCAFRLDQLGFQYVGGWTGFGPITKTCKAMPRDTAGSARFRGRIEVAPSQAQEIGLVLSADRMRGTYGRFSCRDASTCGGNPISVRSLQPIQAVADYKGDVDLKIELRTCRVLNGATKVDCAGAYFLPGSLLEVWTPLSSVGK